MGRASSPYGALRKLLQPPLVGCPLSLLIPCHLQIAVLLEDAPFVTLKLHSTSWSVFQKINTSKWMRNEYHQLMIIAFHSLRLCVSSAIPTFRIKSAFMVFWNADILPSKCQHCQTLTRLPLPLQRKWEVKPNSIHITTGQANGQSHYTKDMDTLYKWSERTRGYRV